MRNWIEEKKTKDKFEDNISMDRKSEINYGKVTKQRPNRGSDFTLVSFVNMLLHNYFG